ncbi:CPS_collapsed_G0048620.mRNA.1.CDS.1 [Saccharomyces cerevisiae]|nr:CPS_collapsed_G0048620.mRNA.1.CDS.1 [Saccharomyces cerevisiae]
MEHVSKRSIGQFFKRKTSTVDGSKSQKCGTTNQLRKLLHKRRVQKQVVPVESQYRIPGDFRDNQSVRVKNSMYNSSPSVTPSTHHINERYVRYDINTRPLVVVLAISIVFFGCLLVLKDIIIQSSENILSVSKWKIIGASLHGYALHRSSHRARWPSPVTIFGCFVVAFIHLFDTMRLQFPGAYAYGKSCHFFLPLFV